MDLFSVDEKENFRLNLYDDTVLDLESLFATIKSFSLSKEERKKFNFNDITGNPKAFNVIKIDNNSYQLIKYSTKYQKDQEIYLYDRVNLIKENKTYPIYCELQVKYLMEKILKLEKFSFYLDENGEKIQINLKDFEYYPGRNIEIKVDSEKKFDNIFNREKNKEKKLCELNLNYHELFENQEVNYFVFNGEGRKQFQNELDSIYTSLKVHYKYYCGQSGIGKTVSLLDYRYKTNNNVLYLNMNILFKKISLWEEFNKAIKNELIYLFNNYDQYNSFINRYEKVIFPSSYEHLDSNKSRFSIIKKLIEKLLEHFENKAEKIMVIIDQYIKKHDFDYGLTNYLEKETKINKYLKFVCCCSTDEIDVRDNVYDSLFEKKIKDKKFISIKNLIKIDLENLTEKQKKVSEMFNHLPKYFYRIKNTIDEELDSLIETLKKEIYDDIRKSIKKMNIENEVIFGLLKVMYNIKKKVDKDKLKSLFRYIFLKFIVITPSNSNEKYFVNFWEEKEENFILNYSFPILPSVFKMILKEYKKKEYKQILVDCTEAEEGYILEHLIYLSFDSDSGEKLFKEGLKISKSYGVDQIFYCSKFFVNINEKESPIKMTKDDYINSLFEIGKNYHLYQKNENGPKFDGALLISAQKNPIEKDNIIIENNVINLIEEENVHNKENKMSKKTIKNNIKIYDIILYQATKKKVKNRINNEFVNNNKEMIIKNLELLFNIKIRNFNFIYILEYEKKDKSLIKFCESIENQIGYIFYSLEKNTFVDRNGEEININRYISEIKANKNFIQCIDINRERNEKLLKKIISDIPKEFDIEKGEKFLTKKRNIESKKINYKKENNFLRIYDANNNLIIDKDLGNMKKTKYEDLMEDIKSKFFKNYTRDEEKEDNNNEISEKASNIENTAKISNQINDEQLNIKQKIDREKYELIKDIIYEERHTKTFTSVYNNKIKQIILEMSKGEKSEKILSLKDKNIVSYYCGDYNISILNNPVNIPFYYLYINKEKKDNIKIFIKNNNKPHIFDYKDGKEIIENDYIKEINAMMNVEKFQQDNLIMFCLLVKEELKREIRTTKDEIFEYGDLNY